MDLQQLYQHVSSAMLVDQFFLRKRLKQLIKNSEVKNSEVKNSEVKKSKIKGFEVNNLEIKETEKNNSKSFEKKLESFKKALGKSQKRRESRRITWRMQYPKSLPVSQKVDEIKQLIQLNSLIIVAGETGSGKSTQLPKICLDLGLGEAGMIAHTQPRRIAARTLASRISDEVTRDFYQVADKTKNPNLIQAASSNILEANVSTSVVDMDVETADATTQVIDRNINGLVACKMRFSDSVQDNTQVKLMTDGMLLAEIQNDPFLSQYQCIIIDEAHERSLNIDFLLGFIKQLLNKRKDLKVIITSATIDVDKMSQHFSNAPILEVSGRNFPVTMHYLTLPELNNSISQPNFTHDHDESSLLVDALEQIISGYFSQQTSSLAQDILVFFPTENEIRQASHTLKKQFERHLTILPLYSRLPLAQQKIIFSAQGKQHKRRLVLATNVAETSVTVPNIGFVIDTGRARISRYNARTKVQQLPIEKISQASANQRAGRCGRIAPGVCIRLYSEEDFLSRNLFTQPEIQRTHLASVILKLESLNLGRIEKFPLIDAPDSRYIKDAYKLLFELQAIDGSERLSKLGKQIVKLAVDPRFAAMLIEAGKRSCLEELLIIVSGLSVNNPKLRPQDYQEKADKRHAAFKDDMSDFLSIYQLWHIVENQRQVLSVKRFKKYCEENFLSWNSLKEWKELHRQLLLQMRDLNFSVHEKRLTQDDIEELLQIDKDDKRSKFSHFHKSILKGVLGNIAHFSEGFAYEGQGRKRLYVFPGSTIANKKYPWLMSAQLLETSKLYAHDCAPIEVEWILEQAKHLIKIRLFDVFWSKKRGRLMAYQESSLGGLILEAKKAVAITERNSHLIKDDLSAIFIQNALIERRLSNPPKFLKINWQYIDSLISQEKKHRRVDLVPDDGALLDFYRDKIPNNIFDSVSLLTWVKEQTGNFFDSVIVETQLMRADEKHTLDTKVLYPDTLPNQSCKALCQYVFDPISDRDGLNIHVRFDQLNQLNQQAIDWLVPGFIQEKCEALIKSLPKNMRKQCLPVKETAQNCLNQMTYGEGDIYVELAKQLTRKIGSMVTAKDFHLDKLATHLRSHIVVLDDNNKVLASASSVNALRVSLRKQLTSINSNDASLTATDSLSAGATSMTLTPQFTTTKTWDFGDLQAHILVDKEVVNEASKGKSKSYKIKMFTALKALDDKVGIAYYDSLEEASQYHEEGQRLLMGLALSSMKRDLKKRFQKNSFRALKLFSGGDENQLFQDVYAAIIDQVFFIDQEIQGLQSMPVLVYCQKDFETRLSRGKSQLFSISQQLLTTLDKIAEGVFELRQTLSKPGSTLRNKHLSMIEEHLLYLIRPGFVSKVPFTMLLRFPLYIEAMQNRVKRLQGNIDRDERFQSVMDNFRESYQQISQSQGELDGEGLFLSQTQRGDLQNLACLLEEFAMLQFCQNKKPLLPVSEKLINRQIALLKGD